MNLYDATIPVFSKYLSNFDRWIEKASAFAEAKKFDREILVEARLAPDQYPLRGQVQGACDTAKFAAAKMTGKESPSHPDTEKTIDELRARIRSCLNYLEGFTRDDFAGAEERTVTHAWMQGKTLRGGDYLDHYVLPNFHFHLVTGYSILRHNGLDLGKVDFMGNLPWKS